MTNEPINDDLVTIKTVTTLSEADIICAVLVDNGIDTFIPDSLSSNVMSHIFMAINRHGVKVQVMARDAEAAAEILDLGEQDGLDADEVDHDEDASDAV